MKALLAASLALTLAGCSTPTQIRLDRMVDELCAKDGGIRVYEVVRLPDSAFNKHGQINFYNPTRGHNSLGQDYLYEFERKHIVRGPHEGESASLVRMRVAVTLRASGRLLGEAVFYVREGGDLIQPNIGSRHECPALEQGENNLFNRLFVPEGKK